MSRIASCLQALADANKKALVPYIVCGDPSVEATLAAMHAMVGKGASIIELGVPFSDPMAEGPVIQKGHERALVHHVSLRMTLDLVAQFREQDNQTPVVLMGYTNPIERMGYATFADHASEAGVDGVLTVDLPAEEAGDLHRELQRVGIDNIFLLAPTTTGERAQRICAMATGYLYYVSLKGVTGAGHLDIEDVKSKVAEYKQYTDLPFCVGFGIKDADSAKQIASLAEGAVVGSVLVDKMAAVSDSGATAESAVDDVASLLGEMREAIDSL